MPFLGVEVPPCTEGSWRWAGFDGRRFLRLFGLFSSLLLGSNSTCSSPCATKAPNTRHVWATRYDPVLWAYSAFWSNALRMLAIVFVVGSGRGTDLYFCDRY